MRDGLESVEEVLGIESHRISSSGVVAAPPALCRDVDKAAILLG